MNISRSTVVLARGRDNDNQIRGLDRGRGRAARQRNEVEDVPCAIVGDERVQEGERGTGYFVVATAYDSKSRANSCGDNEIAAGDVTM